MPYTSVGDLEAYLGLTLTAAQSAAAAAMLDAVDAVINDKTGRVWVTGQQIESFFQGSGRYLFLSNRPVTSIDEINVRSAIDGSLTVIDPSYYRLEDASIGRLYFPGLGDYYEIQVTYTPNATLDPRLKLAANMILAHFLNPVLNGISMGIKRYSVAGAITIEYDNGLEEDGIPNEAALLLDKLGNTDGFVLA